MAPIPLPSSVPLSEECLSLPPRPLFLSQHVSSSLAQVAQSGSGLRSLLHPARLAAERAVLYVIICTAFNVANSSPAWR